MVRRVKNGRRTKFCRVNWVGEICLKSFSLLFSSASHKNATIGDLLEGGGNGGQLLVQFRKPFQDQEVEGFPDLWRLFIQQKGKTQETSRGNLGFILFSLLQALTIEAFIGTLLMLLSLDWNLVCGSESMIDKIFPVRLPPHDTCIQLNFDGCGQGNIGQLGIGGL